MTLQANFLFAKRGARNQYLLRSLIKCSLCGRTYIGVAANRPNGKREFLLSLQWGPHAVGLFEDGTLPGQGRPRRPTGGAGVVGR